MKTTLRFLTIFIAIVVSNVCLLGQATNENYYQIPDKLINHLQNLNSQWLINTNVSDVSFNTQKTTAFSNHENLITTHLQLVENTLRNRTTKHLTALQKTKRTLALDILKDYWQKGEFPKNTYHSTQTPYFIDNYNTACAVGHLMRETNALTLANTIANTCNYAYISEMPYQKELATWAYNSGFTVDELKWIQPSYGPQLIFIPSVNEPNCGSSDGSLDIEVQAGDWYWGETPVEELLYQWDTGAEGTTLHNISSGKYCLSVYDVPVPPNQNVGSDPYLIMEQCFTLNNNSIFSPTGVVSHETCPQAKDGSISLNLTSNNYSVNWYNSQWELVGTGTSLTNIEGFPQFGIIYNGISQNMFHAEITNGNGCKTYKTFGVNTLNENPYIFISQSVVIDAGCGAANGYAEVTHDQGVTVLWNDGSTNFIRNDLAAGNYTIIATNAAGCIYELNFEMTEECPPQNCNTDWFTQTEFNCGLEEYITADGQTIYKTIISATVEDVPNEFFDCEGNFICYSGGLPTPEPNPNECSLTTDIDFDAISFIQTIYPCPNINCNTNWFTPSDGNCGLKEYVTLTGETIYCTEPSAIIADVPNEYYDCEGNFLCQSGGYYLNLPSDECSVNNAVNIATLTYVQTIVECSNSFCNTNWFTPNLLHCGLDEYVALGGTTIYVTQTSPIVADGTTNYYDCNGTEICYTGGIAGLNMCEGILDITNLSFVQTVVACSEPCLNGDFSWAENFINNDCICKVDQYIDAAGNAIIFVDSDCNFVDDPDTYYDCEGNWLCSTNGELMPESYCEETFLDGLTFVQNLYSCNLNLSCSGVANYSIQVKALFEGGFNGANMSTNLLDIGLLPTNHPYAVAPWNYNGNEQIAGMNFPDMVDWVMVCLRNADANLVASQAALINANGDLVNISGEECIVFPEVDVFGSYYISVHHRGHLAVMSSVMVSDEGVYDFTTGIDKAMGNEPMKYVNNKWVLFGGDYDGNGLINNLDFNNWHDNGAAVNQYLEIDIDANGVVNNLDYNVWELNRSKIGNPNLTNDMSE